MMGSGLSEGFVLEDLEFLLLLNLERNKLSIYSDSHISLRKEGFGLFSKGVIFSIDLYKYSIYGSV